jgi:glycosyltransferase involved in cell wall biosynthesis
MNIWLLTIGEPVPVSRNCGDRLHRTGYLAHLLNQNGHKVIWWTSAFDHFHKKHLFDCDTTVEICQRLVIKLLCGGGYSSNLSLKRILDHRRIAKKFCRESSLLPVPDLLLCGFPTIELSLASVKYGLKNNVPVVLDMRDMWPDIFLDSVSNPMRNVAAVLAWPMFRDARAACANATAITGITEEFVEWGLKKAGRPKNILDRFFPMGYVSKPPNLEKILEAEKFWDKQGIMADGDDFVVCFIGTLGRQFDMETVLSAAHILGESGKSFSFVICGRGDCSDYLCQMAAHNPRVIFPGWVDAAQIHVLMRRSKVGLDPMPDRFDFLGTINNKAIEYLSAGLPIISSPERGVLSDLLKRHQCGMSYPQRDTHTLADVLLNLYQDRETLQNMSKNASRLFKEMFTAETVYGEMMQHLVEIAEIHRFQSGQSSRNVDAGNAGYPYHYGGAGTAREPGP